MALASLFSPLLFMMVYDNTNMTIPLPFVHHCRFLKPQSTGNWFYFHHYINRIYCVLYTHSQTLHQHVLSIKLIYSQGHLHIFRLLIQWLQLLKAGPVGQHKQTKLLHVAVHFTTHFFWLLLLFCSQCDHQRQPPEHVSLWTAELQTITSSY
jgi:hypothetical protein